jgi:YD repeat-containing protein
VGIAEHFSVAVPSSRRRALCRLAIATLLTVAFVLAGISACARTRGSPNWAAFTVPGARALTVSHTPWQPKHKGGVDLSTGIYTREDDDLVLNTPMPLVLHRAYNSGDGAARQFGRDWTHAGEWWLHGDGNPSVPWADLILETGGRIHFERVSPGTDLRGAVLRHDSTPTEFNGALLGFNGSTWEMRFRDGSIAMFLDCPRRTQVCALLERRDADGHRIAYVRDASGTLLRMETEGRGIAFVYDDRKRIVRAFASSGSEVQYRYDDRGRIVHVVWSDGTVRDYAYDEHDKLVGVREPGRIITNWFDASGRWIRQIVKRTQADENPYIATAGYIVENGRIVESQFDEGDGLLVSRYNEQHYIVSETVGADGPAPIVFSFDLDASNRPTAVTLSCQGPQGPITRSVPLTSARDDATKASLVREHCWRPGLRGDRGGAPAELRARLRQIL